MIIRGIAMLQLNWVKKNIKNTFIVKKIISVYQKALANTYAYEGDMHDFWELVFLEKGEMTITADQSVFQLYPGQIVFHKPNQFHNISGNKRVENKVIIIGFECNSPKMSFFENRVCQSTHQVRKLFYDFIELAKETYECRINLGYVFSPSEPIPSAKEGNLQLLRIYLEELLILLYQENINEQPIKNFDPKQFNRNKEITSVIIDYMKQHLYQKITIQDICKHLNYQKTFCCQIFKEETGYSIMDYFNILKIAEAKYLISTEQYTIQSISELLCFSSPQYFSLVFKKITGETPQQYRKTIREKSLLAIQSTANCTY